ncbi:tetratricopeptide repeat protein [Pikeienuella piscinae]|uniref:Tetratricopeptide repeat protein n=1 Tax=Pikeienuella piscinae TaxID=2748098 RepID=A0A7L5BSK0_9RHOB|nr:tetratricopeptide repeat protein [Pikeienuella piscinae]QIE54055.1 tetratricopeptide repeat protein [Pikeienuella piscinae]
MADESEQLRAQQAELYQQMLAQPSDPELMVAYARTSVELEDYEAAIATLERALIYEPDEPLTHLELGVAYFRIGSYKIAEYHFGAARAGGLPPDLDSRAALYLEEIEARTQTSRLTGVAGFGLAYSTNANLGPKDELISFLGLPALIPSSATSQPDFGVRATLGLRHTYDLGGSNTDALITEFGAYSLHYFDETDGDVDVVAFTTGPRLSLDNSAYGPKARPFIRLGHSRVSNDALYSEFGVGVDGGLPVNDTFAAFGRLGVDRREFHNGLSDFDSFVLGAELGGTLRAAPGVQVSGGLFAAAEFTDSNDYDNQEIGLRAAADYSYAPGIDMVDGLWTLSGHARVTKRYYDDPDPVVDPTRSRDDTEFNIGAAHLFRIQEGFGIRLDADYFNRNSDIPNFDFDNLTGALSVVYEF